MAKFRKKPVVIEAFRFQIDTVPDWFRDHIGAGTIKMILSSATIQTLEGDMKALAGDWIIKGVKGEIYPCKPDIFEATYEKVK